MKNPPDDILLRRISPTFGVAVIGDQRVVFVQLEDGHATDLVELTPFEFDRAREIIHETFSAMIEIMEEAQTAIKN